MGKGRKKRRGLAPSARPSSSATAPAFPTTEAKREALLAEMRRDMDLLLFETPSGFAIFMFYWATIYDEPDCSAMSVWRNFGDVDSARRIVWLREFRTFADKTSAINVHTGVNRQLAGMIKKWLHPGEKLAVGKPEYKSIIETSLGIICLHDEIVMELMWGIQQVMPSGEKSKLTKADRLPMSLGLQMVLRRYGFGDTKQEMVNEQIVMTACILFDCDDEEKKAYEDLHFTGRHLKDVSGIDYEKWGSLKLATAFKIICSPEIGDSSEMFSEDILSKLMNDADKYKEKIDKDACLITYKIVVSTREQRIKAKKHLASLVKKAKEDYEAELGKVLEK